MKPKLKGAVHSFALDGFQYDVDDCGQAWPVGYAV
jgi:hypothetical protein